MPDPTKEYTEGSYTFVETSDWWKGECAALPSFAEVCWPDYSTKVLTDTIKGQPVVIQLWKGWCQKFLGRDDFPGGIGAEVGVYHVIPGKAPPTSLPHLPQNIEDFLVGGLARLGGGRLWWAYPELQTQIDFQLVNPKTGQPFFAAGPETTYWMNKWMNPVSYEQYRRDQGHNVPVFSAEYVLKFTIEGKDYQW
jgi:hypothetical protein